MTLTALSLLCAVAWGQSAAPPAEFEAAAINPPPPPGAGGITVGCRGGPGTRDPAMIVCENMSLTMLLTFAYNINYNQIAAPAWMAQQTFNITARVPPGSSKEQVLEMWQRLFIDRFKLAAHHEPRIVPKYELVLGKPGPKFKVGVEQNVAEGTRSSAPSKVGTDGFPELSKPGVVGMNGRIRLYQTNMTMQQLATNLSGFLRTPVVEKTGLTGAYEIRLYWVDDTAAAPLASGSDSLAWPTLVQAVQEQLGLRLEPARGPIDFLVVDHMEKLPTGN